VGNGPIRGGKKRSQRKTVDEEKRSKVRKRETRGGMVSRSQDSKIRKTERGKRASKVSNLKVKKKKKKRRCPPIHDFNQKMGRNKKGRGGGPQDFPFRGEAKNTLGEKNKKH